MNLRKRQSSTKNTTSDKKNDLNHQNTYNVNLSPLEQIQDLLRSEFDLLKKKLYFHLKLVHPNSNSGLHTYRGTPQLYIDCPHPEMCPGILHLQNPELMFHIDDDCSKEGIWLLLTEKGWSFEFTNECLSNGNTLDFQLLYTSEFDGSGSLQNDSSTLYRIQQDQNFSLDLEMPISHKKQNMSTIFGTKISELPLRTFYHVDYLSSQGKTDRLVLIFTDAELQAIRLFLPFDSDLPLPSEFSKILKSISSSTQKLNTSDKRARKISFSNNVNVQCYYPKAPPTYKLSSDSNEWDNVYQDEPIYPEQMTRRELIECLSDMGVSAQRSMSNTGLRLELRKVANLEPNALDYFDMPNSTVRRKKKNRCYYSQSRKRKKSTKSVQFQPSPK